MSFVNVTPDFISQAAGDLAGIGSSLGEANVAAALSTTGVLAPGLDEVSQAITALLSAHAQEYQALSAQAANFHNQFVSLLNSGVGQYLNTEADNAQQALSSWVSDSAPAAASPFAGMLNRGGSYQSLATNTIANLHVIESDFIQQTAPLLIQAATNPFGAPQGILAALQTGSVQPLLSVPGQIATGSAELVTKLSVPVSISSISVQNGTAAVGLGLGLPEQLVFDAVGAPITGGIAAGQSATQLVNALATGNVEAALSVVVDAPAAIADGFLNGQETLSIGIALPGGLGGATAEIPVAGLLAPLQPFSVEVTVPGLPFVDTVAVTGPPVGGLVPGVNSAVQQIAGVVAEPVSLTATPAFDPYQTINLIKQHVRPVEDLIAFATQLTW